MVLRFDWVGRRPSRILIFGFARAVSHCMMAAALAYRRIVSAGLNDGVTVFCWRIVQGPQDRWSFREARWLLYARIPNRSAYMNFSERITMNPEICHGKPTIRGLRYTVESILELLSSGMAVDEILADYEDLEREDILAALDFARQLSQIKRIEPIVA